jgi:hypothetical protein
MMDTHLAGTLSRLSVRLDNLFSMVEKIAEEIKEIRQTGVAVNFQIASDSGDTEEESPSETGTESTDSANTWP